jgi:CheY-like chemotaxis protein
MSTSTEVICCELQEEKDMAQDPVDIVVVDDNEVLLSVLTEILKECGCSVRTALDGLGALSEIRNRAPEVLLSDLNMPHMSGFELLSIVRRRYPRIKVVAMSGSYSGQCVPNGVAADAFYEKGATSVARLLQIVAAVKNAPEARWVRVSTPIWIPRLSSDSENRSNASFACPECLRAYSYSIDESDPVHHKDCPYCQYRIQLAIVPIDTEMDRRSLSASMHDRVRHYRAISE